MVLKPLVMLLLYGLLCCVGLFTGGMLLVLIPKVLLRSLRCGIRLGLAGRPNCAATPAVRRSARPGVVAVIDGVYVDLSRTAPDEALRTRR